MHSNTLYIEEEEEEKKNVFFIVRQTNISYECTTNRHLDTFIYTLSQPVVVSQSVG